MVLSLAKTNRHVEKGQGYGALHSAETQVPPMLFAGLTSTAPKNERILADISLEVEAISQCGSGGLDDVNSHRLT